MLVSCCTLNLACSLKKRPNKDAASIRARKNKKTKNPKTFIDNKKSQKEWLELTPPNQKTVYFLTSHGLYAVEQNKIAAFALFSKSELEDYKSNNKMLSIFTEHSGRFPAQSCARSVTRFLKEDK